MIFVLKGRSVKFRRKTVGSRWRHFFCPFKKKEMRAGWSSAEGSRIGWGPVLKIQIRKKFQTFMHAPPYKCCVQVPARMIGKDQSNLNRSHHSSSSVKAVSRGAAIT